jgi:hypothetical protein
MSMRQAAEPQAIANNIALTYEQELQDVKDEGIMYIASLPGVSKRPMNIDLHGSLHRILEENHCPDIEELHYLHKQISYRMNQTYVATVYKDILGLKLADCHQVQVENHPKNLYVTWIYSFLSLRDSSLFDRPQDAGRRYMKGEQYLATCIVEAGWTWLEGVQKLNDLISFKSKPFPLIPTCTSLTSH